MMPRLGPLVRSMRPSQRRALGGLLAVILLSILYSGSYAVLRLSDHLVHDSSRKYGERMFCNFGGETVISTRGRYEIRTNKSGGRMQICILRFFTPMIRIEMALRDAISRFR